MMIDPRGLTPKEWCDYMVQELERYGQAPILMDDDWKRWGQLIIEMPGLASLNPPDPAQFDNFEEWAMRFNSAVPL